VTSQEPGHRPEYRENADEAPVSRIALPVMRGQGHGRIVTITSIGGKVSVPHLLPYSTAKFAAVGFPRDCGPS